MPARPDFRPSKAELEAARGKKVPDLIAPGLSVLFCGINPSLYSAAVRHHFARPGNRFWKTLEGAGFTDRLFSPHEERALLQRGIGITNVVARATASASELTRSDYLRGARLLARKVEACRPRFIAFVGITAYRIAADAKAAQVGLQSSRFAGAEVWVLPNPSGLNAHYQLPGLIRLYSPLARAAGFTKSGPGR